MMEYIQDPGYGISKDPLAFAVVWNGLHPTYDYTIRMNSTSLMYQGEDVEDFQHYAKLPGQVGICQQEGEQRGGQSEEYQSQFMVDGSLEVRME